MSGESEPGPLRLDMSLRQSWDIRRRRHQERRMLVRHNDIYELSELADAVWCNTVDDRTFAQVIAAVVAEREEARGAAAAAATTALEDLITMGFVVAVDEEKGVD